jgi:Predicted membrane protein
MSVIGNIFWILCGGLISSILWAVAGLILCVTIVGIPFGLQCFKIAGLTLAPFGRNVESGDFGAMGLLGNILWIIFLGIELALCHIGFGLACAVTIIGIPFAIQHFKLAKLSLMPFGARII